ncbi:MAG TPA: outer membrane lipoprotein chaperone LolA [Polyangia bacterium]|nr:outer membrane lipoprotein chaperone LolA [Polyangia bacterium]
MKITAVALCVALAPLAHAETGSPPAQTPPPSEAKTPAKPATDAGVAALVARMQKFYESTRDLHARFEQVVSTGTGRKRMATGDVWLKKPGRMRWDYQKPEKKLMVADGETLWIYEPEDQQVFRQSMTASSLPSSVSFLFGKGRLSDEFEITRETSSDLARPGEVVLKLVPRQATAQYRYLVFLVDEKTAMVTGTVVYDQQGGQSRLDFQNVEVNRGVADDKFQFKPPAGTRILQP